jgi:hypothetical protein
LGFWSGDLGGVIGVWDAWIRTVECGRPLVVNDIDEAREELIDRGSRWAGSTIRPERQIRAVQ